MRLADKIATMARRGAPLPYLRRVAYLESHGTEWIDTGIRTISKNSGVRVSFEIPSNSYGEVCVFGICDKYENSTFYTYFDAYTTMRTTLYTYLNMKFITCDTGDVSIDKNVRIVNSVNFMNDSLTLINSGSVDESFDVYKLNNEVFNGRLILFGTGLGSEDVDYLGNFKCYEFEFSEGQNVLIHLIPVLDLSGRPAMYDDVSGQFFYNQGSGEFTWGELDAASSLSASRGGY